jgi:hypothetical protein
MNDESDEIPLWQPEKIYDFVALAVAASIILQIQEDAALFSSNEKR